MAQINKKHLHHLWTRFRAVSPRYLALGFVILLLFSALALRNNYQTMDSLRQDVYRADKDNGDVEAALRKLRRYVYAHMNTDLSNGSTEVYPPIQLTHTYERLQLAAQAETKQVSSQIYTEAQAYCEKLYPQSFSGGPRVPCIRDYVSSKGVKVRTIPDSLYKFDFVSPSWSPDVAGFSLVLTGFSGLLLTARLLAPWVLKRLGV